MTYKMADAIQDINNKVPIIGNIINVIMNNDSESSSSSSDSDDETLHLMKRIRQEEVPKFEGYVEIHLPKISDFAFRENFRMDREHIDVIERMINTDEVFAQSVSKIPIHKQILMALWILATPESFRSVAERFGVAKSILSISCRKVWTAVARLSPDIIKWPTLEQMRESETAFRRMAGFPGVVGCIDGSHIPITAPKDYPIIFINRKGWYSIVLQAVVNEKLEFIDVCVGRPGSMHDARIFRQSRLFDNLDECVPPEYHLLGDSAYPLGPRMMTPFRDNGHLIRRQVNYNTKLSKTRVTVERCFGVLKGKFRRLKMIDTKKFDMISTMVLAACVLHNISRRIFFRIEEEEDLTPLDDDISRNEIRNASTPNSYRAGNLKRDRILNAL